MKLVSFNSLLVLTVAAVAGCTYSVANAPATSPAGAPTERVVAIKAKRFTYTPDKVVLKRGEPVVLELTTEDRKHGFKLPALDVRADVLPGQVARVRIVPDKTGTFAFYCDSFCGSGHEEMDGTIVVTD